MSLLRLHASSAILNTSEERLGRNYVNRCFRCSWAIRCHAGHEQVTLIAHNEIGGTRRMSVLTYVVLICFAIFGIQYWLKNKSYIFQAKDIEKIARDHVGKGK